MTINRFVFYKALILLSMWWGWTFLVDFFIVPTLFRNIDSFFAAGDLGLTMFSKLNILEVIVSSTILSLFSIQAARNKNFSLLFIGSILLWIIAMTYFTYLTPKIHALTELWKTADLMGTVSIGDHSDIQQAHQFYHGIYVGIDAFKLLLITVMIFVMVLCKRNWA